MKTPFCASPHRSAVGSAKSSNDPAVARPTRFLKTPAAPASPLLARRSPVRNRCLQNSPAVTTESRFPAPQTDAHCSRRRTSRIPSLQSHQTSHPPRAHSPSYKTDGPAPSLLQLGQSRSAPAAVSAFASPSPSMLLPEFNCILRQTQTESSYTRLQSYNLTFATGC